MRGVNMSSKQVLFIHNHITFEEIVQAGFADIDDWHISTASSVKSMLIKITQNTPDLIFLDFESPGMDGLEILIMIRNYLSCRSPVVVFITKPLTTKEQKILTKLEVLKIIHKSPTSLTRTSECAQSY